MLLNDPDPPAQEHSPTSQAVAERIQPLVRGQRKRIYDFLMGRGDEGATDEEMQTALAIAASTQRPRRIELVAAGYVRGSGKTRPTRSGCQAVVWIVTELKPTLEAAPCCPTPGV